ncbi:MAG: hypothetical protein ACT4NT_01375 [Nitrososphaerota archaeon]
MHQNHTMPLSSHIILYLNQITSQVQNKNTLSEKDEQMIKDIFSKMLQSGQRYDVEEIEAWFENHGGWTHRPTVVRIANMSHYVQSRFDQNPKKIHVVSDHDDCSCS